MLDKEYYQLIDYIEKLISDGVKLVYAGHLIDWKDTKILKQIKKIKEKDKEKYASPELNSGDQLRHKISKQDMWVIHHDGETVFLNPGTPTVKYPLDKILSEFEIVKSAKENNFDL